MLDLPPLNPLILNDLVAMALREDFGRAGDITSNAIIPATRRAQAVFRAREAGVMAGGDFITATFRALDAGVEAEIAKADGARLAPGDIIATVEGPARAMLAGERVALNFLGRLCGIASLTALYVEKVQGTKAAILCTRKTTPGLRAAEKYAVRCGGGMNHRFGLDDAMLIKDNHIAVAGGVAAALRAAKAQAGHMLRIEIEVDTLAQLEAVLATGLADIVMLDNMPPALLREAVMMTKGCVKLEASGGVNLDTVAAIAATGVDMISVGALTHSARVLDIGLDID